MRSAWPKAGAGPWCWPRARGVPRTIGPPARRCRRYTSKPAREIGRSLYWSAWLARVIGRPVSSLNPTLGSLVFDVACRTRPSDLGSLESRYRLLRPPREFNHERAVFDRAGAGRLIVERAAAGVGSRILADVEELRVFPAAVSAAATAQTVRWVYRVALA